MIVLDTTKRPQPVDKRRNSMALHVLDEANRCLGCKKPMCQQGCPIHTNIPEVIRLLKANELDAAGGCCLRTTP